MSIPFCSPSFDMHFHHICLFPLELATHNNILLIINSAFHDPTSVGWCLQMEDVKHALEVLQVSVIQSCTVPRIHVLLIIARFDLLTTQLDNPQSNQHQPNTSCFWSGFFQLMFSYLFCCHPSNPATEPSRGVTQNCALTPAKFERMSNVLLCTRAASTHFCQIID